MAEEKWEKKGEVHMEVWEKKKKEPQTGCVLLLFVLFLPLFLYLL